jgi:hypothetical protein
MKQVLSKIKQRIFHGLKLYPIYDVLNEINKRFPLKGCHALEAFSYTGAWQARAYRDYPAYHEAWEIDPWCKPFLEKNLPKAKIKITNSFEEVLRCDKKFDFINVDTHQGLFGAYCENFEFFPLMFRIMKDECVVNLNVIPYAGPEWRKKYSTLFNKEHLERREAFYRTGNPEEVTLDQMLKTYGEIAKKNNYSITWHYYKQRTLTYYLVLHLKKTA